MKKQLIIATKNENKVREMARTLGGCFSDICSLNSLDGDFDIIEDGATFCENALIKAQHVYNKLQVPVLADDSGLCAEALNFAPGIYSARYAGQGAGDEDNNRKLLAELKGHRNRNAYFECCIVLMLSEDRVLKSSGRVYGWITDKPAGDNGFGYDPVFLVKGMDRTMAQLSMEEKNRLSHRSRALEGIISQLKAEGQS